jgi:hypothetical protein
MVWNIYAHWPAGAYLVATSTDSEHGLDHAERVCQERGVWPHAFSAIIPGEHVIKGPLFELEDLPKPS